MNDCKTIHEVYWEAICVEYMLKHSRLWKATSHEGKSPQTTKDYDVEPVAEDIQTDTKPKQETKDSMTTFGSNFPSLDNGNQKIQAARETEELDMVREEIDHLMDLVIGPLSEKPLKSSKEQACE